MARSKKTRALGDEAPVGVPDRQPKGKRSCEACAIVGPAATVQLCLRRTGRPKGLAVTNATDVCTYMNGAANADRETFYALHLDARHKIVDVDKVATGSMTGVDVHPREVFKSALLSGASSMIFVHNHPSGESDPSRQDIELTQRLRQVGELVGIAVLDHIIVADSGCTSLASRGLMGAGHPPNPYELLKNKRRRSG